ncbi:MAG: 3-hydroxybutyryl-CoA dehydrogenase [Holosporales bacterium]
MTWIGVIGSGQMGQGIAQVFATQGFGVVLVDSSKDALNRARDNIKNSCQKLIQKNQIPPHDYLANITFQDNLEAVVDCSYIIEAIVEDMTQKKNLFKQIDAIKKDQPYVLCTNTSALSLKDLASDIRSPTHFIGLHFMNPPVLMPLIELITTDQTAESVIKDMIRLVEDIKKTYVLCKDAPGFIVNRILIPMINEACLLLDENLATPHDIDSAMKCAANFPMGPLTLADFIGLDTVLAIMKTLSKNDSRFKISTTLQHLVDAGKLGKKTGLGFFNYEK